MPVMIKTVLEFDENLMILLSGVGDHVRGFFIAFPLFLSIPLFSGMGSWPKLFPGVPGCASTI